MFLRGRPVPMLIPDELAPTYSLDTRSELPSSRLKLDWVYPLTSSLSALLEEGKSWYGEGGAGQGYSWAFSGHSGGSGGSEGEGSPEGNRVARMTHLL